MIRGCISQLIIIIIIFMCATHTCTPQHQFAAHVSKAASPLIIAGGKAALLYLAEAFARLKAIEILSNAARERFKNASPYSMPTTPVSQTKIHPSSLINDINQRWIERMPALHEALEQAKQGAYRYRPFIPPSQSQPESPSPDHSGYQPHSQSIPQNQATSQPETPSHRDEYSSSQKESTQPFQPHHDYSYYDPFLIAEPQRWAPEPGPEQLYIIFQPSNAHYPPEYIQKERVTTANFLVEVNQNTQLNNQIREQFNEICRTIFSSNSDNNSITARVKARFNLLNLHFDKEPRYAFNYLIDDLLHIFFDTEGNLNSLYKSDEADIAIAAFIKKNVPPENFEHLIKNAIKKNSSTPRQETFERIEKGDSADVKHILSRDTFTNKITNNKSNQMLGYALEQLFDNNLYEAERALREFSSDKYLAQGAYKNFLNHMIQERLSGLDKTKPDVSKHYRTYDSYGIVRLANNDPQWKSLSEEAKNILRNDSHSKKLVNNYLKYRAKVEDSLYDLPLSSAERNKSYVDRLVWSYVDCVIDPNKITKSKLAEYFTEDGTLKNIDKIRPKGMTALQERLSKAFKNDKELQSFVKNKDKFLKEEHSPHENEFIKEILNRQTSSIPKKHNENPPKHKPSSTPKAEHYPNPKPSTTPEAENHPQHHPDKEPRQNPTKPSHPPQDNKTQFAFPETAPGNYPEFKPEYKPDPEEQKKPRREPRVNPWIYDSDHDEKFTVEADAKPKKKKKEQDPCDTSELIDGIVNKKQLEEACKKFSQVPGAWGSDGPLTRVYDGLNKRKNAHLPIKIVKNDIKGSMFELQVALQLVKQHRGIAAFGFKCLRTRNIENLESGEATKFQDSDYQELDILTKDGSAIECKNINSWPNRTDHDNKSAKKINSQIIQGVLTSKRCRSKQNINDVQSYSYEIHSAKPIPENWKVFMLHNNVFKIVDNYCPPDCGII
jgi:hypothetical protein